MGEWFKKNHGSMGVFVTQALKAARKTGFCAVLRIKVLRKKIRLSIERSSLRDALLISGMREPP